MITRIPRPLAWTEAWNTAGLEPEELRLYVFELDLTDKQVREAADFLGPDEIQRSKAFATPHLAGRFLARRAWRRRILASLLKLDAAGLQLRQGPWGRPYLLGQDPDFSFSTSSRGALGALLVGHCGQVSVDIETRCGKHEVENLAPMVLGGSAADWASLSWPRCRRRFMAAWVALEAGLKLSGEGLRAWQGGAVSMPRHSRLLALRGPAWLCVAADRPWRRLQFHLPSKSQEPQHA